VSSPPRPGYARVRFDEAAWAEDLARARPEARSAARQTREELERTGQLVADLKPCLPEAPDGTRLPGCTKAYVPSPDGPWGLVYRVAVDETGAFLAHLAYGLRHPPAESRQPSVYAVADRRLGDPGTGR